MSGNRIEIYVEDIAIGLGTNSPSMLTGEPAPKQWTDDFIYFKTMILFRDELAKLEKYPPDNLGVRVYIRTGVNQIEIVDLGLCFVESFDVDVTKNELIMSNVVLRRLSHEVTRRQSNLDSNIRQELDPV